MSSASSAPAQLRWNTRPDDLHHHLRDGDAALALTAAHVSAQFARCIVMPNLVPPVTTTEQALAYRERIVRFVPEARRATFEPLMTLYMTDGTTPEEIRRAHATGKIFAVKLYPGTQCVLIESCGSCRNRLTALPCEQRARRPTRTRASRPSTRFSRRWRP
jgi:dihydroorotase